MEADEEEPERDLAEPLRQHPAAHLREPVVERGHHREGRAAERRVVEVGDDEVGVGQLPVDGEDGEEDAGDAAHQERGDPAHAVEERDAVLDRAAPQRRDPVEDLHAGRHRDQEAREHEEREHDGRHRRREHVVRPHQQAEEGDAGGGRGDRLVAEDRLAGEHRQDLGEDAERGQHEDVDLGVAEEPEQVLPQQRRAALGRVEERRPEVAVQQQHRHRRGQRGERDHDQVRVDQDRPHEQRDAAPAHAGRAHVVDRGDEVDRAEHRRQAGEVDHVDPRVLAAGRRVLLRRQRQVGEPAGLGRGEEDRRVERDAAEQEHPVGPRVDAREGDVARPDHQRQQVVREARPHRHDDEEDHRRPVHGEDLVVLLGRQERVVRRAELDPQQEQRLDPSQQEEDEDRVEVHDPDLLVVGRGEPRRPAPDSARTERVRICGRRRVRRAVVVSVSGWVMAMRSRESCLLGLLLCRLAAA